VGSEPQNIEAEREAIEDDYDELLTTGQVARILNVGRQAVNKWVKKGQLKAVRTPGGHIRIRRSDIDRVVSGEPISDEAAS
jgi:excisionase family DNA binding protein